MKISLYQIIILAISSVMLFQGTKEFVKREAGQTFLKFMVRVIVWGGMAIIAVYPNATEMVSKVLGFKENMNAVIILGFLLVFMLIFKLLSAIEKIEQNISELTRKEALSHLEIDYKQIEKKDE
ncbi:DUF2304 domain-containing protein [Desulfopila sp. IMCC35008]|uniref:DUF2304 domain-containing protein n=1 Tax=Desulfopila sp. IMCC35008 TaxID=2653858 RepID=UPI0013D167E5|nr:DUF2304 domain-containing protein [Desulfopila sp. IMCC35008]